MKSKAKILAYSFLPAVFGLSLLGSSIASAHGLGGFGNLTPDQIATAQQNRFQTEAQILGISVDEVKTAWAAGKTQQDIMKEKNISQDQVNQKMKTLHDQQLKTQLQTLVDKGVITQAQSDVRLKALQDRAKKMEGKKKNGRTRGHGMDGFGFGF